MTRSERPANRKGIATAVLLTAIIGVIAVLAAPEEVAGFAGHVFGSIRGGWSRGWQRGVNGERKVDPLHEVDPRQMDDLDRTWQRMMSEAKFR